MPAGDTIRSAADLNASMVAVMLLHRQGYFRQRLDLTGWQTEEAVEWDVPGFCRKLPARVRVSIEGLIGIHPYDERITGYQTQLHWQRSKRALISIGQNNMKTESFEAVATTKKETSPSQSTLQLFPDIVLAHYLLARSAPPNDNSPGIGKPEST